MGQASEADFRGQWSVALVALVQDGSKRKRRPERLPIEMQSIADWQHCCEREKRTILQTVRIMQIAKMSS